MTFNVPAFLATKGARTARNYSRSETIFTPGDACQGVLYVRTGGVRLSAVSKTGKVAELAILGPGEFFGEACLAGQPFRIASATAMIPSTIVFIAKKKMLSLLHLQCEMSDWFISHMLTRIIRGEEDLVDQLVQAGRRSNGERASGRAVRRGAPAGNTPPPR